MAEFLDMGGYAAFVWPAYAITIFVIAGLAFSIRQRGRGLRRRLNAAQDERER